jgi:hypothetical protein
MISTDFYYKASMSGDQSYPASRIRRVVGELADTFK